MADITSVVQGMMDAGEPEEKIREVVRLYKEREAGKAQDLTVDPTMSQDDMGSELDDGSSGSRKELSDAEQFSNVFANAGLGLQEAWESTKIAGAQFGNYLGIGDDEEVDNYIVERYKKLDEISAQMGDTGKGIVKGVKEGDFADVGIGVVNALTSVITTVAPALLTRGASLVPQIMAPMYTEYNSEKAKKLYGDNERAVEKLIENNEDEVAIPMALGVASVALERVGIKGISSYVLNNAKTQGAKRMANLVLTGNKEGLTEYFQGGLNVANKSFAQGDSTAAVSKKVFDHMGSEDALEEYVQGFVGGSGMSAAGAKINSAFRDKNDNKIVNDYVNTLGALNQQKVASKTEEAKDIVDKKIKEIEKNFKEFLISNQKKSEYLTEEQSTEAISILDTKKELSVKLQDINNKLKNGEINKSEHSLIVEDINNQFETNNKNLNNIKVEANKKLLHDDLRISGEAMSKIKGLSQKIYKTPEDFLKALNAKSKKQYTLEEIQGVDGLIVGKEILINETVAAENNAVTVGSHELLHAIVKSSITGKTRKVKDADGNTVETDLTEDGAVLIKDFLNELNSKENKIVQERIDNNYRYNRNAKGEIVSEKAFEQYAEEYLNAYADAAIKNELSDSVLEKLGKFLQKIFNNGDKGYQDLSFKTGKDVKTFLKSYVSDRKKGSFRQQFVDMAQEGAGQESTIVKKSMTAEQKAQAEQEVKDIGGTYSVDGGKQAWDAGGSDIAITEIKEGKYFDDLIAATYKADRVPLDFVKKVYSELTSHIKRFNPEENNNLFAYINSQVRNKAGNVYNREYKVEEPMKGAKDIDARTTEGAPVVQIAAEPTQDFDVKTKQVPKSQRARVLKSLADVNLDNKEIISATARAEIDALIEKNPKNLEAQITSIIDKEITKAVKAQMGKISNVQGEVVVSEEYKAFIALNYENIVQSLDVNTIKNNYKTLFELTEIGKEDRKTRKSDKPSLKKDSNYRKGIFKIETNKAKFTKFFTEGGYTTLLARQKGLANQIAKGITEDVINNEIIENSNNIDAVIQAEIADYGNKLNRQKNEVRGNYADQIKFSKTVNAFAADIQLIENPTFNKIKTLYTEKYATTIDRKILDNIEKIFDRLGPKITVKEFREAAGDAVITRGKGINFTFYDSIKEFLEKAFPEGNVKVLDLMTEGGETSFMNGLKGLTALMDPRVLNLSLITNTFLAGNSLYTYSSGTRVNLKGKTVPKSISKNEIPSKYNTKGKQDFKGDLKKAKGISSQKLDKVADLVEEYNNKPQTEANQKELAGKIRKLITQENIDAIHSVRDYFYSKINEYVNQFEEGSVKYYEALAFVTKLLQIQTNASSGISRQGAVLNSVTLDYSTTRKKPRGKGIKRYQFEHNIQLLNFNMNVLKSIIDNKFNKVYPLVSSTYSATLLDADAQLVLDSKDGVTTKEFDSKYPGYKTAATGKTKAAPGFMIGMDSEAMFMIALGNAERTLHIPSGLMYDKLLYNKINKNATLDYLDGVAKKIDSNIKFSKSKKTVFNPANSSKIFKNSKNKSIFNSILQKSIVQEDVTQEVGELAVRIDNSEFFSKVKSEETLQSNKTIGNAINFSRSTNNPTRGITVLDFDDTLATSKSLIRFTKPDGTKGTLNAEQYASTYQELTDLGYTWDFSEFNKVVDGKTAPLFNKAMKLQGKFGPENMFVLTARPMEAAPAIFAFLQANGLNIPLKNITGLANSTAEAKALWMVDKVSDGYNDFYFADDALQNVQAVDNILEQFDVKRKVQQARVKFSNSMNDQFNDILENVTGIESDKRFSAIKGRKRGEGKGKFRFFIPPSHEDFVGLLYNFLGKGKEGNAHRDFFEQALVRPLNRANREFDTARQSIANDYKALNKQFAEVKEKLTKKTPDGDFTNEDAVRVYLWNKHDHKIPGLTETDQAKLVELVQSDPQLQAYAETLNVISKQETYVNPTEGWNAGDIRMDLDDATGRVGRKQFFAEFIENTDIIFSEENLNKIEAGYGKGVRESLEDMLYRIKTGRNRPSGSNEQVNKLMNFLNGSVGTVMFFNMRSALLQQMSIVNYINFADNNVFAAAKAFANQKQYWADFAFIFNSDMLKQRRGGIQTDVNGAELAASLRKSKNPSRVLISKLLELGFLPTQIGDNIAIATGGASYYRNKINTYLKQGLSQKEAEAKAFTDFQDITQSTQQSARPDMVSKQQASVIGKVILNFQNVTSQFNRLGKKAFQDIYNRRITKPNTTQMQSDISNASRITYYFAIQNMIFYTLQTALFAMMFDDDEEDVNNLFLKKKERLINGSIDSVLRGTGLIGGVVATLKNVAIAFARQRDVNYNPDESAVVVEALNLSPVIGIKARQIVNAEKTLNYNKKIIDEMETFDIDNPQWSAVTNYVQTFTNLPVNRLYNKTQNVRQALNNDHSAWERSLMFLGWSQYNLDLENKKMKEIKEKTKSKKKTNNRSRTRTRTRSRTRTR